MYFESAAEVYNAVEQHELENAVKFFKRSTTAAFGGDGNIVEV